MKEQFIEKKFSKKILKILEQVQQILKKYDEPLTLRQLYYQLVTINAIPNLKKEYNKLSRIINDARYMGLVDWDIIEDRARRLDDPSEWNNVEGLMDSAFKSYRLPRWREQDFYVEVWLEKEALAGIFTRITNAWHIKLLTCKGYNSASMMYQASKRFIDAHDKKKKCVLLYFGDFDPSGEDMVRDIKTRLSILGAKVNVKKIAILKKDITQFKLPPQMAKTSDPRHTNFVAEHGEDVVEIDALPLDVLKQRIEESIKKFLDVDKLADVLEKEEQDKKRILEFLKNEGEVEDEKEN